MRATSPLKFVAVIVVCACAWMTISCAAADKKMVKPKVAPAAATPIVLTVPAFSGGPLQKPMVCILPFTLGTGLTNAEDAETASVFMSELCRDRFSITRRANVPGTQYFLSGKMVAYEFSAKTSGGIRLDSAAFTADENVPNIGGVLGRQKETVTVKYSFNLILEDARGGEVANGIGKFEYSTNSAKGFLGPIQVGSNTVALADSGTKANVQLLKDRAIKMAIFSGLTNMLPDIDRELQAHAKQPPRVVVAPPVTAPPPARTPPPVAPEPQPPQVAITVNPPAVPAVPAVPAATPPQPFASPTGPPPLVAGQPPAELPMQPAPAPTMASDNAPARAGNPMLSYIIIGGVALVLVAGALLLGFRFAQHNMRKEMAGQVARMESARGTVAPPERPAAPAEPLTPPRRDDGQVVLTPPTKRE